MIISFLPCDKCGELTLIGKLKRIKDKHFVCEKCCSDINNSSIPEISPVKDKETPEKSNE